MVIAESPNIFSTFSLLNINNCDSIAQIVHFSAQLVVVTFLASVQRTLPRLVNSGIETMWISGSGVIVFLIILVLIAVSLFFLRSH